MKKLNSQEDKIDKKQSAFSGLMLSAIISAVLLGVLGVSYIRTHSDTLFPAKWPQPSKKDALRWYNAVVQGNEKKAILWAAKMIPDESPELPSPDFIQSMYNTGLGTLVLTSPFNHFDYLRWKDAFEIKNISNQYSGKKEPITEIFNEVLKRKKTVPEEENRKRNVTLPPVSCIDIWNSEDLPLDQLVRLFSALSYQLGYSVQVVSLYDQTRKLQHVVCELRKNDESYVADFVHGKIWKGITVSQLARNSEPVKNIWPANLLDSINNRVYLLPAEAMDFKLYNMNLAEKLHELGVKDIPRFGNNPQRRIDEYINKYSNKSEKSHYTYWKFPFKSLMSSPNFPQHWRLPPSKRSERK